MNREPHPCAVFAYGTLKRGECREQCWPCAPIRIAEAFVQAELYDLGPYPALAPGNDPVLGEVRIFSASDMPETLRVLDEIEGFAGSSLDLYARRTIECRTFSGERFLAWTYYFADSLRLLSAERLLPDSTGFCRWRRLSVG